MNLFTLLPAWAWIVISSIFFAFGEFISKKFALNPGWTLFIVFLIVDILSAASWLPALFEKNQLSVTGVAWSVLSLMATVIIGIFVFNERLTLLQTLGLAAGLLSVVLLSI
jgi:multidrug transporter EmrE-like cation transporter